MNEIIKELYEQSLIRETGKDHAGNPMLVIKQNPEKFARLILQEIIEELEADVIDMDDDPDDYERGYDNGVKSSVAHIKEHFGVE